MRHNHQKKKNSRTTHRIIILIAINIWKKELNIACSSVITCKKKIATDADIRVPILVPEILAGVRLCFCEFFKQWPKTLVTKCGTFSFTGVTSNTEINTCWNDSSWKLQNDSDSNNLLGDFKENVMTVVSLKNTCNQSENPKVKRGIY